MNWSISLKVSHSTKSSHFWRLRCFATICFVFFFLFFFFLFSSVYNCHSCSSISVFFYVEICSQLEIWANFFMLTLVHCHSRNEINILRCSPLDARWLFFHQFNSDPRQNICIVRHFSILSGRSGKNGSKLKKKKQLDPIFYLDEMQNLCTDIALTHVSVISSNL